MKRPNNVMKKRCTKYCLAIPSESQICQNYIIVSKRNLLTQVINIVTLELFFEMLYKYEFLNF